MRRRQNVNKRRSTRRFKHAASRTRYANVAPPPMRGGIRL